MDIMKQLQTIEEQLETYQDTYDPEEKMDLKQTIQAQIKQIKASLSSFSDLQQKEILSNLNDFEEILTY